jgi:Fe-S oxidoreductase
MNPVAMGIALFGWGLGRRWRALGPGRELGAIRLDTVPVRWRAVLAQAVAQARLRRERGAGLAHLAISAGFVVLLVRTLILWGRGFDPSFHLWVLDPWPLQGGGIGALYTWMKDLALVVVLVGVAYFAVLRLVVRPRRMTLNAEGIGILAIIATMMIADAAYDGASLALAARQDAADALPVEPLLAHLGAAAPGPSFRPYPDPVGSACAVLLRPLPASALRALGYGGFWAHALLVLGFLVLLPHGKHFHVITAVPNLFLGDVGPPGHLPPLATSSEELGRLLDAAAELDDPHAAPLGIARIEHLSPKARLDLFACTECGRCTARCPAALTGKVLSPKAVIVNLRDHLRGHARLGAAEAVPVDLVPAVVATEALWACTTCRACEEECPLAIHVVDKLIGLRRHLLTVRGDGFPRELGRTLEVLESTGDPYGRAPGGRLAWAEGLSVPTFAERPSAETLLWIGCAAVHEPGARRAARATVALLHRAGVDFAVLGAEESCTGDLARRAGNEALFLALAERNLAVLDRYARAGGARRIVTGCPHCLQTLRHDYAPLGLRRPVMHTAELLHELVLTGRLAPGHPLAERVVVHDACYLARYGGDTTTVRELLARLPGLERAEVPDAHGLRALCCGGGGAQAFLEEQNRDRVSHRRAAQLAATGAGVVATSCPFCTRMLSDGLPAVAAAPPRLRDVAELVAQACGVEPDAAGGAAGSGV